MLLTLDTHTVDLSAPGVDRTDGDFALAWIRNYGKGRVFYSAFGHFPESFSQEPVRTLPLQALLWLTGQIDVNATPRSGPSASPPSIAPNGVRDLSGSTNSFAPGSIVAISGDRLTSGSFFNAAITPLPVRLAGTHVEVNGISAPLFSVKPDRLLLHLPTNLISGQLAYLSVSSVSLAAPPMLLPIEPAAPAIVGATRTAGVLVIYLTGLGVTDPPLQEGLPAHATTLLRTLVQPSVSVGGQPATVFFSGLTPGLVGLYQINVLLPGDAPPSFEIIVEAAGHVPSHSSSSPKVCSARLLEAALASCGEYIRSAAADDAAYGQFAHLASSRRGGSDLRVDSVHARIAVGSLARGHVREPNGKAPPFGALRWRRNAPGSALLATTATAWP